MIGRFNGGKLGGRPFNIAGTYPPKGLEVANGDGSASRYRREGMQAGVANYTFVEERREFRSAGIRLDDEEHAIVALPYFPQAGPPSF